MNAKATKNEQKATKEKPLKTFSKRLQYLIDIKKISQTQLANDIDTNRARVSDWLNGKIETPRRTTIHKLSDYFGCNIEWLATGKGEIWPSKISEPVAMSLSDETLQEIQTWLNEMEKQKPGFKTWFCLEFQNRFPEFEEWKK